MTIKHASEVEQDDFARCLVLGAMKAGKTSALLETAPSPLVINCDGKGATRFAAVEQECDFLQIDVTGLKGWKRAVKEAFQAVKAGEVETVIVDTVTLLADDLVSDLHKDGLVGFDLWGALALELQSGLRKLLELEAHLFIVAHFDPTKDPKESPAGIVPMIPGGTKVWLPGRVSDWILFEYEPDRKPDPRAFLLGPQKYWTHSGRRIKRSTVICPPDVGELLDELGLSD